CDRRRSGRLGTGEDRSHLKAGCFVTAVLGKSEDHFCRLTPDRWRRAGHRPAKLGHYFCEVAVSAGITPAPCSGPPLATVGHQITARNVVGALGSRAPAL